MAKYFQDPQSGETLAQDRAGRWFKVEMAGQGAPAKSPRTDARPRPKRGWTYAILLAVAVPLSWAAIWVAPDRSDWRDRLAAVETPFRPAGASPAEGRATTIGRGRSGHYIATAVIGGRRFSALVDTGASFVGLTYGDAIRAGIDPAGLRYTLRLQTANGIAKGAPVRLASIQVGEIVVRNVEAVVMEDGNDGANLLGMSFLNRLSSFEFRGPELVMRP